MREMGLHQAYAACAIALASSLAALSESRAQQTTLRSAAEPRLVWARDIAPEAGQVTANPSVVVLHDGTVVFVVQTTRPRDNRDDAFAGDALLAAFAPDGNEAWRARIAWGAPGEGTKLVRVAAHAGGAITLAGLRAAGPKGNSVLALAQRHPSGRIVYDQTPRLGSGRDHLLQHIERVEGLPDGGALVYGHEFLMRLGGPGWYGRFDPAGRLVSRGEIGGTAFDDAGREGQPRLWAAWPEADGGVTVFVDRFGAAPRPPPAFHRFDRAGRPTSTRSSSFPAGAEIVCAVPLADRTLVAVLAGERGRLVWIGADGAIVRERMLAEKSQFSCWCEPAPDGGFVLAVEFGLLRRFGGDGAVLWAKSFERGRSNFTTVEAIAALGDGGAVVAGIAEGSGTTEETKTWRIERYARP